MAVQELIGQVQDAATVRRVFGEPYEVNGLTVIPAAKVAGGGGEGHEDEHGSGGGFGVTARPVGAYVVEGRTVRWRPAVDVNRVALGGQIVGVVAILTTGSVLRAYAVRRRPLVGRRLETAVLHGLRRRRRRPVVSVPWPRSRRLVKARSCRSR